MPTAAAGNELTNSPTQLLLPKLLGAINHSIGAPAKPCAVRSGPKPC